MIRVVQRRPRIVPVDEAIVQSRAAASGRLARSEDASRPCSLGRPHEQALYDELATLQPGDLACSPQLIAVLVPVLDRPHRVGPLVASFEETGPHDARLYFVAQHSDTEEIAAIESFGYKPILVTDADRSWAKKINRGMAATSEPWLLLGADDLRFHVGWVDSVRALLHSHPGVIGTNDLGNSSTISGRSSTHPLVRRSYAVAFGTADERGKVLHEGYDHNFPDSELVETAKARGLYIHERRCIVEHLHPLWGKAQTDHVYQLGQRNWNADQALFMKRCREFGIGAS